MHALMYKARNSITCLSGNETSLSHCSSQCPVPKKYEHKKPAVPAPLSFFSFVLAPARILMNIVHVVVRTREKERREEREKETSATFMRAPRYGKRSIYTRAQSRADVLNISALRKRKENFERKIKATMTVPVFENLLTPPSIMVPVQDKNFLCVTDANIYNERLTHCKAKRPTQSNEVS